MTILLVVHFFITLALIGIVLIQRSEGGGLGMGGANSSGSFFSARGSSNLLTRTTAILATLFMVNCLAMTIVAKRSLTATQSFILADDPVIDADVDDLSEKENKA